MSHIGEKESKKREAKGRKVKRESITQKKV